MGTPLDCDGNNFGAGSQQVATGPTGFFGAGCIRLAGADARD